MNYREIGYRIQIAREEAGLNQKELSEVLGISQASLSNYEKGKRRVYYPQLQKIADSLNKPLDYFMQPIEWDARNTNYNNHDEFGEIIQLLVELKDLHRDDRKSVFDYIKWLKSKRKEENHDQLSNE
ncbi:MAG TPA: helix-turn-helix domain-containing protein [Syntrophomonadaceae bacterium]|nr:helix-turn-helix domain-containing protein [Syntrophomonadaceae bacterium]HRX20540.1 helix-turn-helix domain-containing protein [Syntrophomonadaceae bacterium]